MRYVYCPPDPKHYAADLHLNTEGTALQWACGRGQDVLLVRTPYGQDAEAGMEALCASLGEEPLPEGRFTETGEIGIRPVSALERVRSNGCPLDGEARTYTVFACVTEGDTCRVFSCKTRSVSPPRCDVPMRIPVEITAVMSSRGLFRKNAEPTGFYRIAFPQPCDSNYADGDLVYRIGDFRVPITRRMFEAGAVYVKTLARPGAESHKAGLELLEG